jgi:hypothetical protein
MARLIPTIDPSEIRNEGEQKLAKELVSRLGSDVEIFHSFRWLGVNERKNHIEEHEADFVIVDPSNGILFVEVKGGEVRYDTDHEVWYQMQQDNPKAPLKKNPVDQAQKAMHDLTDMIEKSEPFKQSKSLPFTFGFAVAFPECSWKGGVPKNITPDLVWDAAKCTDLRATVQATFDRWRRFTHPRLGTTEMEAIYSALFPRFKVVPVLWRKVEDQEQRIHRLTADQEQLLEFMGNHKEAVIKGVAGSGKTILALAKAQACAREGLRTLLLCYNSELQTWLEQAIPESLKQNLVVKTFHGLTTDFCKQAHVDFNPNQRRTDGRHPWRDIAPSKLIDACSLLQSEHKFDAIIVDEGQDFEDLWWTALDGVFREEKNKGCYYVFYDPKQNIFVEKPSIPDLGKPFLLPVNCRNTRRIAEHCSQLIHEEARVKEGAPLGDEPQVVQAPNLKEAFRLAAKKVREWCMPAEGGLRYSQVAVLASGGSENDWPKDFGPIPLTKNFSRWRTNEAVLMASWGRFKGLEADAIVIVDDEDGDKENRKYVARSRAKHLLSIIEV